MHAITSGDLVYPDPVMHPNLHDMHINPPPYHLPQPSLQNQNFSAEGPRNGQSEQDMERFIDIFLQVRHHLHEASTPLMEQNILPYLSLLTQKQYCNMV